MWRPLLDQLAERGVTDTIRLSPPGFGAPVPNGFDATMAGYHALVAELEAIDGPVDLSVTTGAPATSQVSQLIGPT